MLWDQEHVPGSHHDPRAPIEWAERPSVLQSNDRDALIAVLAQGTSLPPEPPPALFLALRQEDVMLSRYFQSLSSQISGVTIPSLPGSDPAPLMPRTAHGRLLKETRDGDT